MSHDNLSDLITRRKSIGWDVEIDNQTVMRPKIKLLAWCSLLGAIPYFRTPFWRRKCRKTGMHCVITVWMESWLQVSRSFLNTNKIREGFEKLDSDA